MTRIIRIGELADALHRGGVHRAFAMLRGYFDDSGSHERSPVVAIGGFIAPEETWKAIEPEWLNILAPYRDKGVKTFHMTDALAQDGEYKLIEMPHVNYIIAQCAQCLGRHKPTPFFSAVVQDDWDAAVTDAAFLARFPKPLDLCFDDLVRCLSEWGAKHVDGELIVPMFAIGDSGYNTRFQDLGNAYTSEVWYHSVLGTLAFDYPSRIIPLQCADLYAHQIRHHIEKKQYAPIWETGETNALSWAAPLHNHGHWFDAGTLSMTVQRWKDTGEIYSVP